MQYILASIVRFFNSWHLLESLEAASRRCSTNWHSPLLLSARVVLSDIAIASAGFGRLRKCALLNSHRRKEISEAEAHQKLRNSRSVSRPVIVSICCLVTLLEPARLTKALRPPASPNRSHCLGLRHSQRRLITHRPVGRPSTRLARDSFRLFASSPSKSRPAQPSSVSSPPRGPEWRSP